MSVGFPFPRRQVRSRRGGLSPQLKMRLIIAAIMIGFSVISYLAKSDKNEVTGKSQRVAMSEEEEVALGMQAAPQMIREHGGHSPNRNDQILVQEIGFRLVNQLDRELREQGRSNPYRFEFHLLADSKTINAFALPGGQVFITNALFKQLKNSDGSPAEGQIAGVLGHEIGHVLERHGAQRMAKQQLTGGVVVRRALPVADAVQLTGSNGRWPDQYEVWSE